MLLSLTGHGPTGPDRGGQSQVAGSIDTWQMVNGVSGPPGKSSQEQREVGWGPTTTDMPGSLPADKHGAIHGPSRRCV